MGRAVLVVLVILSISVAPNIYPEENHADTPTDLEPGTPSILDDDERPQAGGSDLSGLGAFFTENLGQRGPGAGAFYCEGDPLSVAFGRSWVGLVLRGPEGVGGACVRMHFDGAQSVEPVGGAPTGGVSSFFLGDDPTSWVSGARNFGEVRYHGIYDGINLVFKVHEHSLKYEFLVTPHTDPSQIVMTFEGAEGLEVDNTSGALAIITKTGIISDAAPITYQDQPRGRCPVPSSYMVEDMSIRFSIGRFDSDLPLTVDPSIAFCTYIGGTNVETVAFPASFVDETGNIYLAGTTSSTDFPTTYSEVQETLKGDFDVFVAKLNASGDKLIYSTFIGGVNEEWATAIDVDTYGYAYVTGMTHSVDFPMRTMGSWDPSYDESYNGNGDVFVVKVNGSGTYLCYSTYIGSSKYEKGTGIAIDSVGCAYVAASTSSSKFPTTDGAYDESYNGNSDLAIFKLNKGGTDIEFSTFVGGSASENVQGVYWDETEDAFYLTGYTNSTDFPTTSDSIQKKLGGGEDVFILKLDALGKDLQYSSYLGGSLDDRGTAIFIYSGRAYITGSTSSNNFPVTYSGYDQSFNGMNGLRDAFVVCMRAGPSGLLVSGYLGGSEDDCGFDIFVDDHDRVWACGRTYSDDFPITEDAYDGKIGGECDGYVCRLDVNGSQMEYSTLIGGEGYDDACNVQVVLGHLLYIVGETGSADLPTTIGAFDTTYNGPPQDAYIIEIDLYGPRQSVLVIDNGPRLYAGYKAYDFIVDINPLRADSPAQRALLTFIMGTKDIVLGWDPTLSSNTFYKQEDPQDLVTLHSTSHDQQVDEANGTVLLHFRVMFGWSWPHEDPCNAVVLISGTAHEPGGYLYEDIFSVENDLELLGNISVSGEWQGPVAEGAWVRAGENLTISGPIVVYEGTTDVYPPAGCCNISLRDNEGDGTIVPNPCGQPIELTMQADAVTDPSERLSLGLIDLPGTAESRADLSFALRVDGELPTFENPVPEPDDWHGSSDVMVSITINDSSTSGVDASSIEYSCSEGTGLFGPWTALSLEVTGDGPLADGLATVALPDGADNFIRWRAKDLVGNGWAVSDPFRIKVDTRNVTFRDPVPDPDRWFVTLQVPCGVTIDDLEGAGIDVSTVQWRTSPTNLSHYGPWHDWDEGAQQDNVTVLVRATLDLAESGRNYVQWRAMDIAGNGFTTSPHYRVRTDVSPVEFTGFEPGEDLPQNRTEVTCWVTAIDRPGGSGVNLSSIEYRWGYDAAGGAEWSDWTSSGMEGVMMQTWFSIVLELRHGPGNLVQLRGSDQAGNGPTTSAILRVTVDTVAPTFVEVRPEPTDKQSDPDVLVTLTLRDDFTGVDCTRVEYRTGPGPTRLGEWSPMAVVPQTFGDFSGSVRMLFAPGKDNHFQFRVFDLAGNAATSAISSVWVNRPPVAMIASPAKNAAILEEETVWLSANGSMDPDEDMLMYTWLIDGTAVPGAVLGVTNVTLIAGFHNITLVVTDDVGAVGIAEVLVNVEEVPPPVIRETDYSMYLVILIVLIIASILLAMYLHVKRHRTL